MSKPIQAGDTVEILTIHKESNWYKQRKQFIGKEVKLKLIEVASLMKNPWKFIKFNFPHGGSEIHTIIRGVKVRRMKK